ncbi:hypothetical protein GF314_09180 [bacterium]|nr:hypothetical protein [bacterium]
MQSARFPGVRALGALALLAVIAGGASAVETSLDAGFGATAGTGVQAGLTLHHFTRDVPLSLRLAGAYSTRDAGRALDARRVFINDNTNGTPEESADTWQFRLDLMTPLTEIGGSPVSVGLGLRHASFTGTFNFVGGNEKFDVTSSQWGVGLFLETAFAVSDRLDFMITAGADHFLDAALEGHDTTYDPDGDHANPRDGYDFESADDAVNQPTLEFHGLLGLRLRLGD